MSIQELLLVAMILSTLLALRIGVPLAVTWCVGTICRRLTQPRLELR